MSEYQKAACFIGSILTGVWFMVGVFFTLMTITNDTRLYPAAWPVPAAFAFLVAWVTLTLMSLSGGDQ